MTVTEKVLQLPKEEKLKVMEALWVDLSSSENELESPEWHGQVLRETQGKFDRGEIEVCDWEAAKKKMKE